MEFIHWRETVDTESNELNNDRECKGMLLKGPSRDQLVNRYLNSFINDFLSTQGKKLRSRLFHLFSNLYTSTSDLDVNLRERLLNMENLIEWLHAGSLIIDDIQDGSTTRRNRETLHIQHGVPIALNIGNALYFRALNQIQKLNLDLAEEAVVYRLVTRCIMEAHEGQSIDLGVKVDELPQEHVYSICLESMESKSGALMECAAGLGYLMGAAGNPGAFDTVLNFGRKWGLVLQMFDDIHHYLQSCNEMLPREKQFEDFRNRRCTWLWAVSSKSLPSEVYNRFRKRVITHPRDPEVTEILSEYKIINHSINEATHCLTQTQSDLMKNLRKQSFTELSHSFNEQLTELNQELVQSFSING
jgi:geranylgeranyl pyrophosphate synthase